MLEANGSADVDDVWNTLADKNDPADAAFLKKYGALGLTGNTSYWYTKASDVILALGSSGLLLYVNRPKNLIISKFSSFVQGHGAEEFAEALAIIDAIADLH